MDVHERVRHSLEEKLGVEETTYLMDRPHGGWSELVTRQMLDDHRTVLELKLEAMEHRLRSELGGEIINLSASVDRRLRAQTWVTATTLIAGLGLFGVIQRL